MNSSYYTYTHISSRHVQFTFFSNFKDVTHSQASSENFPEKDDNDKDEVIDDIRPPAGGSTGLQTIISHPADAPYA